MQIFVLYFSLSFTDLYAQFVVEIITLTNFRSAKPSANVFFAPSHHHSLDDEELRRCHMLKLYSFLVTCYLFAHYQRFNALGIKFLDMVNIQQCAK